jgi:hypothetical protein
MRSFDRMNRMGKEGEFLGHKKARKSTKREAHGFNLMQA